MKKIGKVKPVRLIFRTLSAQLRRQIALTRVRMLDLIAADLLVVHIQLITLIE